MAATACGGHFYFQVAWLLSAAPEAEGESALGYLPSQGQNIASIRFRIIMHIGWLSLIPLGFAYLPIRRHESIRYASSLDS
jgi:hypothetical protein